MFLYALMGQRKNLHPPPRNPSDLFKNGPEGVLSNFEQCLHYKMLPSGLCAEICCQRRKKGLSGRIGTFSGPILEQIRTFHCYLNQNAELLKITRKHDNPISCRAKVYLHLGESIVILLININSSVMDLIPARSDQPHCLTIFFFNLILNILSKILNGRGVAYIPVHQNTIQNHICELRDLRGKLGLLRDRIWTLVPIETKSRNRDFSASTE